MKNRAGDKCSPYNVAFRTLEFEGCRGQASLRCAPIWHAVRTELRWLQVLRDLIQQGCLQVLRVVGTAIRDAMRHEFH